MKKYGAKTYLDYLQKVVAAKNNKELNEINEYSNKSLRLRLADSFAKFQYIESGGLANFGSGNSYSEYRYNRDWSKNIFKWAFKADLGERKSYMKGHNTPGITKSGFISFINDLKKQSLFQVLKNKSERSFRNGHAMIVSGEFKDKKGNIHRMDFVFRAKSYSIYIDKPNIRH